MKKYFLGAMLLLCTHAAVFAQPTHVETDPEKKFKEAKEFFMMENYALAYPILVGLDKQYPASRASDFTYLHDDIQYFLIATRLKLLQPAAAEEAVEYLASVTNSPREQMLSYHLAHYYFQQNEYDNAIAYFDRAGNDNLSNEQIADAKFERAYAYFNVKQFAQAKPLFNEIHQLPDHKYYIPANYYYGFISYYDRQYDEALTAFKLVETIEAYKGVVPYYIAEIYYFQGKKDLALSYGESVLARQNTLYYEKQLKLLMGQLYFEKQQYSKALPLLEAYVNGTPKVSKEILYELSYSYYKQDNYSKAIEGFKQLSNERDSLGQNSMYLLGDLYLKTGQKANARTAFQYSAYNGSNTNLQQVSRFNYGKLSYELGYQDVALNELKNYLKAYPNSVNDTEAREILVNLLTNTNNFSDALALYNSFDRPTVNMMKAYPRILYGRAIELINDQQLVPADELLTRVMADKNAASVIPYANFWKGEIAYRQQRYDDAIRSLNSFLQSRVPAQGEATQDAALYNVGYSYMQKGNYQQALGAFELVTKTYSTNASTLAQDAYLRSADSHFMLRDFSRAQTMYEAIISGAGLQADYATFQKAMIAGIKNSAEKIRLLNAIPKNYPRSNLAQDATMEIALTLIADEKFQDAIPFLNSIISGKDNGLKPKAYLKLGLVYYNTNNNAQALNSYQQLIQKYPQSEEAEEALAIVKDIYVEEGRPNDYVDLMRKNGRVVSVTEADSLTYTAAFLKYAANDCASAITSFTNYLERYPQGNYAVDAWYQRATCYQQAKDYTRALTGFTYVNGQGLNKYFEKATLEAARINYFELKNYAAAKKFFTSLRENSVSQDNQLEALRGLVRTSYYLKEYNDANEVARELVTRKGLSTDDRSVGYLVLGKSQQLSGDCNAAITSFKSVSAINKSAWGAEARYETARCYFTQNNYSAAEKAALTVIKETGSYDVYVTQSYILLGDIFMQQKDYFNAKATYESVAKNSTIETLKNEARQKFNAAVEEEKKQSKIGN